MGKNKFIVISDIHYPFEDKKAIKAMLQFIKLHKVQTVILNGDILDMYDVSSFDKSPERINSLQKELNKAKALFKELRRILPEAEIVFVKGNHCLDKRTDVLTTDGWVNIKDLVEQKQKRTLINYNIEKDLIVEDSILDYTKSFQEEMYEIETRMSKQIVSNKHQVLLGSNKVLAEDIYNNQIQDLSLLIKPCGLSINKKQSYTPEEVELITWVVTDGCLVQDKKLTNKKRIQFKLSKQRKIEALRNLLDKMNIKYSFRECKKTGVNKLQPYYIRIYGEDARNIFDYFKDGKKEFPRNFKNLQGECFQSLINTIVITDGSQKEQRNYFYSSNKNDIDVIQEACIKNGYATKIKVIDNNGFKSSNTKYNLMFQTNYKYGKKDQSVKKIKYNDYSYCLTTNNGTLITRIDGKVAITGNCFRLERYLMKHPELFSLDCLKLPKLLGLDEFDIKYCDKHYKLGPLKITHGSVVRKFSAYTAHAEMDKHDTSGISGHTHRLGVFYKQTPSRYMAWYESGCLCDIEPEYVNSPDWQQGFIYGYVDKESFAVTPIPIVDGKVKHPLEEE